MATTTDIAKKTAIRLGIISPLETLEAEDESSLKGSLTDLHEALLDDVVVRWELTAIPDKAVGALVSELAWYVRDDFDIPPAKMQSLQVAQVEVRTVLLRQVEIPYNGEPLRADYY
jgi:hypothetical protein